MRESKASILDVAVEANFGSQEAFTRAFKTLFGCTPGNYRRNGGLVSMEKFRLSAESIKLYQAGIMTEQEIRAFAGESVLGIAQAFPPDSSQEIEKLWDRFLELMRNNGVDCSDDHGLLAFACQT